ncbi:hypothetical protein [Paenibacillus sp. NPDC057967]|uniref:hypothetical protein n=1 Tax=Paenibacillus sp. NPDC057967 TaxID=3346293 RepID=UPI0036DC0FBA
MWLTIFALIWLGCYLLLLEVLGSFLVALFFHFVVYSIYSLIASVIKVLKDRKNCTDMFRGKEPPAYWEYVFLVIITLYQSNLGPHSLSLVVIMGTTILSVTDLIEEYGGIVLIIALVGSVAIWALISHLLLRTFRALYPQVNKHAQRKTRNRRSGRKKAAK